MPEANIPDSGPAGSEARGPLELAPKVRAAGLTLPLTVLIVFLGGELGLELPAAVSAAIGTIIAFAAGYIKKP